MIKIKKIVRRGRPSSERLGQATDAVLNSSKPMLLPSAQVEKFVVNLRAVIDELDINLTSAKSLILKLARLLRWDKECKQSQISQKKEMLADKIKEGKITKKWIECCLPQQYEK